MTDLGDVGGAYREVLYRPDGQCAQKYRRRNDPMTPSAGKTLMITGGTGSFGEAVLKHLLIPISGKSAFSAGMKKQDDMRHHYQNDKIKYYIGDVRELFSVKNAIHGVDYLFHAAALKQVPSCEFSDRSGSKPMCWARITYSPPALRKGVRKVICLHQTRRPIPLTPWAPPSP